jgi:hypothetical protein
LSAVEGRSMRPTFIHVLTGLLLGTALAGLLNVPGQIVAHQESIPPVHSPVVAEKPKREPVVRVSPKVERSLVTRKAAPPKPRVVVRQVFVPTFVPSPQPVSPPPAAPKPTVLPKPKPTPPAAEPKTVASQPQPAASPSAGEDDDDDDDGGDDDGQDDQDDGGSDEDD